MFVRGARALWIADSRNGLVESAGVQRQLLPMGRQAHGRSALSAGKGRRDGIGWLLGRGLEFVYPRRCIPVQEQQVEVDQRQHYTCTSW